MAARTIGGWVMRAITLKQPWAYAVCHLGKQIENRDKRPPLGLIRQRVAIHAGLASDDSALTRMFDRGIVLTPDGHSPSNAPRGCVVATARLVGYGVYLDDKDSTRRGLMIRQSDLDDEDHTATLAVCTREQIKRWYIEGNVAHVYDDVCVLPEPVPCKGALGYWQLPADVEAEVLRQEALSFRRIDQLKGAQGAGDGET